MKKIFNLSSLLLLCMAFMLPALTSCENDDFDTQQYKGGVSLNVWGPSPVMRGGELRFLGSGMDQINSISIPGTSDITDIRVISPEEIRITVPQDAEPGKLVLHHAGGDITTLTMLSYTEPIVIESMLPSPVKPGETVTIKGDYLNLISRVTFAYDESILDKENYPDGIYVDKADFISQKRNELSLTVPAEAKSGVLEFSDGAEPIPNVIKSEEELQVVLPAVSNVVSLDNKKPGETVTIKGNDLDLVKSVEVPGAGEVEFTYDAANSEISFSLPANTENGTVVMIPASGVKVAAATIGVALPEEVVAEPADNIWAEDVIKFKGINMELVTNVTFPGVADAVEPATKSATEITVKVPAGTQSGDVILNTGSGMSVAVAVKTLQPENVTYNPAPAALAGQLTVNGKNLHNVVKIIFAGSAAVEVKTPSATSFSISVPATLQAGSNTVTLELSNGEQIETPAIELTAPECAYATELPAEDAEINAGETFTLPIANESLLTEVQINGAKTQHILQGTNLIILVPDNVGSTAQVTLVSSNGSITYEMAFIPATHVENVIMNEVRDLGSWTGEGDGGAFRLYKESFKDVPAGAKLVFHVNSYAYTQIQINDANWGQMAMLQPDQSETLVAYELTTDVLDRILTTNDGWSETAIVIQGEGTVVSKVHIEWERSMETVIWEGNEVVTGYGGFQGLAWNSELTPMFQSWKAGQVLRAYYTLNGDDDPKLKFGMGDGWNMLPGSPAEYQECVTSSGSLSITLTDADIDALVNKGGLIIQANGIILTKITIE